MYKVYAVMTAEIQQVTIIIDRYDEETQQK